jgi:hypothetical protein
MKDFIQELEKYGTLEGERFKVGCLEVDKKGYVFNTYPSHFIGHINTVKELHDVYEYYNNHKLSEV